MVKSYRGQEVDLNRIIKEQGDAMALGNTHLNGRGDLVKHGKVIKTKEERVKEWNETHPMEQAKADISYDKNMQGFEEEMSKQNAFEEKRVAKPKKQPKPNFIEEEKVEE